jgi:hypothetical protein
MPCGRRRENKRRQQQQNNLQIRTKQQYNEQRIAASLISCDLHQYGPPVQQGVETWSVITATSSAVVAVAFMSPLVVARSNRLLSRWLLVGYDII